MLVMLIVVMIVVTAASVSVVGYWSWIEEHLVAHCPRCGAAQTPFPAAWRALDAEELLVSWPSLTYCAVCDGEQIDEINAPWRL